MKAFPYALFLVAVLLSACAGPQPWIGGRPPAVPAAGPALSPMPEPTKPWPPAWTTFHYSNEHTGMTTVATPWSPHAFAPAWRFHPNDKETGASLAVGAGGLIYFGSLDGKLFCLNSNGTMRWSVQTGASLNTGVTIGGDGSIYVGGSNYVVAVSATAKKRWTFKMGRAIVGTPTLSNDGTTLYFGSFDHKVYAVDARSGKRRWAFTTGDGIDATPTIGPDGSIYIGSYDGYFYALRPNGTQKWKKFDTQFLIESTAAIDREGYVLFGNDLGIIYDLDPASGQLVGILPVGPPLYASVAIGPDGYGSIAGSKTALYHTLYAADWNGVLHKYAYVDAGIQLSQSGPKVLIASELWHFTTALSFFSSPAVSADDKVYVGGSDRNFYELDGDNGAILGEFRTSDIIDGAPAIGYDGTVYVGNVKGSVYAFR